MRRYVAGRMIAPFYVNLITGRDGTYLMHDEILYSNFRYSPEIYYFLYVGDIKTYGLNHLLAETLSRNTKDRLNL